MWPGPARGPRARRGRVAEEVESELSELGAVPAEQRPLRRQDRKGSGRTRSHPGGAGPAGRGCGGACGAERGRQLVGLVVATYGFQRRQAGSSVTSGVSGLRRFFFSR